MEIANIPLEEVGLRGGGGWGAKYPNIGSDPGSQLAAAARKQEDTAETCRHPAEPAHGRRDHQAIGEVKCPQGSGKR